MRTSLPRYFKEKIYNETQKRMLRIQRQRFMDDELARVQSLSPKEYENEQSVKYSSIKSYVDRYENNIQKSRNKSL